jgi:AcrR family transcriptional regulator
MRITPSHAATLDQLDSARAKPIGKGAATRDAIVFAALQLAQASGLEGLSIGGIAERVGMSKSGVFAHFGSREDLQLCVLKAATDQFSATVFQPALKLKRGLPRLRAVLENMIVFYQSLGQGCVILSASHEFDDQPGPVREAVLGYLRQLRSELVRATQHAVDAGELMPALDAEQFGFECFGIFLAAHHDLRTMRDGDSAARARKAFARLIAGAISAEPTSTISEGR